MKTKLKSLFVLLGLAIMLAPTQCYAGTDESLTYLFKTKAFSGSMETISKLNWVGWLLSGIISVFCLIGLFLTVFRIMTSLMYLSGRNVFDKIHEIKSSNQGEFFGLKSLFSNTLHGSGDTGSGIDTFVYFFLGLLPDVKMYSDFADGKEAKGVGPDTTITEYVLKISIPSIMTIFFLSIGFSGVLWQMFGTVVDAMSVAAEKVADTNLESSVKRLLNADSYYQFTFGDDGTKWGAKQDEIAKSMYTNLLKHADDSIDSETSLMLGRAVAGYFSPSKSGQTAQKTAQLKNLSRANIAILAGIPDGEKDESEAKTIEYSVHINAIKEQTNDSDVVIPVSEILNTVNSAMSAKTKFNFEANAKNKYMHVSISRKKSAISGNYYSLNARNQKQEYSGPDDSNALKDVGTN